MDSLPVVAERSLPDYLRRLCLLPDERREFTVSPHRAFAGYGIRAGLLTELLDAGLPHTVITGEPRMDHHDLVNVSLDLGLRSGWSRVMQSYAQALSFPHPTRCCAVTYQFTCPDPGHDGPCDVWILTPDQGEQRILLDRPEPGIILDLVARYRTRNVWPTVPPDIRALMKDLSDLELKLLPWDLTATADVISRTGWTDCVGGARTLVAEAQRRGIAARLSTGFALVPPSSALHCWAEFLIDDLWVPLDPLMVNALIRWGFLDPDPWQAEPTTGCVLGRLAGSVTEPATHNGSYLYLPMPTVVVAAS